MKAKIEKDALSNIVDESTNNINTDSLLVTEDLDVDTAAAELQQIIDTLEGEFNGSSYGQMIAEVAKLECAIMKKHSTQPEGKSLSAMKESLADYAAGRKPDFKKVAFKMNIPACNLMNSLGSEHLVGSTAYAYTSLNAIKIEDLENYKYCEGIILDISNNEHGTFFQIGFFVGPVPISKGVVNFLLKSRYDGKNNSESEAVANEKMYPSFLISVWALKSVLRICRLPPTASTPEVHAQVTSKKKDHQVHGCISMDVARDLPITYGLIWEAEGRDKCPWCFLMKSLIWCQIVWSTNFGTRTSGVTIFCPNLEDIQISTDPSLICPSGLPTQMMIRVTMSKTGGSQWLVIHRNKTNVKYCLITAIMQYAFYAGLLPFMGLYGYGPFFRVVNVDSETLRIYGSPYIHKDLYPVKATSYGQDQRVDWYSYAAGSVKQSLETEWLACHLVSIFKRFPYEEMWDATAHIFRKTLFRFGARCFATELEIQTTGDWVDGSTSMKKYFGHGLADQMKYSNDPASDPLYGVIVFRPGNMDAGFSTLQPFALQFKEKPEKSERAAKRSKRSSTAEISTTI